MSSYESDTDNVESVLAGMTTGKKNSKATKASKLLKKEERRPAKDESDEESIPHKPNRRFNSNYEKKNDDDAYRRAMDKAGLKTD